MNFKCVNKEELCEVLVHNNFSKTEEVRAFLDVIAHPRAYRLIFANVLSLPRDIVLKLLALHKDKNCQLELVIYEKKLVSYLNRLGLRNYFFPKPCISAKEHKSLPHEVKAIGIGGSSDSLQKIINLVEGLIYADISIFIVQHILAGKKNLLAEILQKYTSYHVVMPNTAQAVQKRTIYVAPEGMHMYVEHGYLKLSQSQKHAFARPSIDVLFESLAQEYKKHALCVLSCGYGEDGLSSLHTLKECESLFLLQEASECSAQALPKQAKALGLHDACLSTKELLVYMNKLLEEYLFFESELRIFLLEIKKQYGYDFLDYNLGNIKRRLAICMLNLNIGSFHEFCKLVLQEKHFFDAFFLTLSINVTSFFRDSGSFDVLKELLKTRQKHTNIWSIGCASGQEAYSIAMLLEAYVPTKQAYVYATDFNEAVLQEAKNALYTQKEFDEGLRNTPLKQEQFQESFSFYEGCYMLKEELLKRVLFFEHNLTTDKSFKMFHIIFCRNVLIYFNLKLQERVFELIYDSLEPEGFLFLGEYESIHKNFETKFSLYNEKHRIYQRV